MGKLVEATWAEAFAAIDSATVTTTPDRVEKMISALRTITDGRGSNMFLFTDEAKLVASNPLDVDWVSGKGESGRLTD